MFGVVGSRAAARVLAAGWAFGLAFGLISGPVGPARTQAHAQDYPNRPVKIIVPTPPGGPVDVVGRLTANYLQTALGQAFVVENRSGAGNTIGSKDAALQRRPTAIRCFIQRPAGSSSRRCCIRTPATTR